MVKKILNDPKPTPHSPPPKNIYIPSHAAEITHRLNENGPTRAIPGLHMSHPETSISSPSHQGDATKRSSNSLSFQTTWESRSADCS
ncbi:hypothetical protein VTL71DRAFT_14441, partial [Oculimacula yallundae]